MAKIVAPPPNREWKTQRICPECGALIELEPQDLTFHDDQREGVWYSWVCPVAQCRKRNILGGAPLPEWVRKLTRCPTRTICEDGGR